MKIYASLRLLAMDPRRWHRRVLRRRWTALKLRSLFWRAHRHRRRLTDVTFIAVTGSMGKTMATRLIASIVSTSGPCTLTGKNTYDGVALGVLRTRRTDRFCVAETPTTRPGYLVPSLRLVRPRIGVVTAVGTDHRAAFGTPEAIAEEKGTLVEVLPADGVAVLNADDPRVLAMRTRHDGRVITYGCAPDATVRAENIQGAWPDRLSLDVCCGTERVHVQTRLCGVHWSSAVVGAMAAGLAAGIPLAVAAEAISLVEPHPGRMSPVILPDGVTFIRDDTKASIATVAAALDFLKSARAARRIAVLGSLSDYMGDRGRAYSRMARAARDSADLVIWVGAFSSVGLRGRRSANDDAVLAFATVRDASEYLNEVLRPGDLVLLKGSNRADHLLRILLARTRTVGCWRNKCGRAAYCDSCSLLDRPAGPPPSARAKPPLQDPGSPDVGQEAALHATIVVGLGNPGAQHAGTPHNVGHAMVETLAATLGAEWTEDGHATIARALHDGCPVCLVKLTTPMNGTGPALEHLSRRLGFGPASCVLVYDDIDLPLGRVRVRMNGSSGGHRGVASILQEFQTEAIRRVKIGVGRSDGVRASAESLLVPFAQEHRPVIDEAFRDAGRKVLELVAKPPARA